jgi:adenylylsulfate reductase subunit A
MASAYSMDRGKPAPVQGRQVDEIRDRLFAPMEGAGSVSWREFEDVLQRTLTEGMGPVRSAWGMEKTWNNLDLIEKWKDRVRVDDYHGLLRVQEVHNMMTVARCMIKAAMFREESRFGPCHFRLDFPETDDERWLGQILVKRDGKGQPCTEVLPISYD